MAAPGTVRLPIKPDMSKLYEGMANFYEAMARGYQDAADSAIRTSKRFRELAQSLKDDATEALPPQFPTDE